MVVNRCPRGAGPADEHREQRVIVDVDHEPVNVLVAAKVRVVSHDAGDGRRVGPVAQQLQDRVRDLGRDLRPVPTRPVPPQLPGLGRVPSDPGDHRVQLGVPLDTLDGHASNRTRAFSSADQRLAVP